MIPLPTSRVLVAGIGNIFLADDAFGPEVLAALLARPLPEGVDAADFGIRGMDLAYRLLDGYDAAVLVDAVPRGGTPGTLYVLDLDGLDGTERGLVQAVPEAHGMDPVKVIAMARDLARWEDLAFPHVVLVGCEPRIRMRGDEPDVICGLSDPVRAAVDEAVKLVDSVAKDLLQRTGEQLPG
ncbi:hydrogenase maturation protease [Streptomyces roseoverticillatus]|uniref:hydrogenase maturation protease n=1 Tax=Streptomyces roseoverticillatus TaxID=66429 RepID=UPI0033D06822